MRLIRTAESEPSEEISAQRYNHRQVYKPEHLHSESRRTHIKPARAPSIIPRSSETLVLKQRAAAFSWWRHTPRPTPRQIVRIGVCRTHGARLWSPSSFIRRVTSEFTVVPSRHNRPFVRLRTTLVTRADRMVRVSHWSVPPAAFGVRRLLELAAGVARVPHRLRSLHHRERSAPVSPPFHTTVCSRAAAIGRQAQDTKSMTSDHIMSGIS
jgi:hypothetical protein